jgi:hypothetical protein
MQWALSGLRCDLPSRSLAYFCDSTWGSKVSTGLLLLDGFIFAVALGIFYLRMQRGFGPYNTSVFLLLLVLFVTSIAFITGKIEWPSVSGLLLAIAGFAGGLVSKPADPTK